MKSTITPFAIMLLLLVSGCSGEDAEMSFSIPANTPPANIEKIRLAAEVLVKDCPGVKRYRDDLEQVGIRITNADGYSEQRDRGWSEFVEFELIVASPARTIPKHFHAEGHHCYFRVGVTPMPGVEVGKKPCQSVCQGA